MDEKVSTYNGETSVITVERAAYVAIGLVAASLRFFQLGLRPLSESEAAQALAAFHFVQGGAQSAPIGTVPALFTGNVVGFTVLGSSDIVARLLPALAGLFLVLLPYGLRHRLGRGGALAASLFLAFSPSALFFSRQVDGTILVAACGLALVVGMINYVDSSRAGFVYLAAAALGLGLCSGPNIFSLLLILLGWSLLLFLGERLLAHKTGWSALKAAWETARDEKGLLSQAGAVLAGTFALVATALVLSPAGIGYAADLLGTWFEGFVPTPGSLPIVYPLLLLVRYEPLIVILGLAEAIWCARMGRDPAGWTARPGSLFRHSTFFAFWAGAATLLLLLPGQRTAGNVLLVVVPLALLSGQSLERAWRWVSRRALWSTGGLIAAVGVVLLAFFYLQVAAYGQASSTTVISVGGLNLYAASTHLLLASVALLLLVGLGALAWFWKGPALTLAGGWLVVLAVLGLWGFKSSWAVNFAHANDARELMIMQSTSPDVRRLAGKLEELSMAKAGDVHTLPVTVDADTGPVVAWYLRDFSQMIVVQGLTNPPDTVAAVTLAVQDLPIGAVFRGQGFPLHTSWSPWGLWGQDLARWLLFTDGSLPTVDQEVVLWVASQS